MRSAFFSVLLLLLVSSGAIARDFGSGQETAVIQGVSLTVFTYRPADCARPALLFVFHGDSRTAARYRNYARSLADRACLLVIAPLFDKARFPSRQYHRGGIVSKRRVRPRAQWTVAMVAGLVDWARRREGWPDAPYYLFGHSAGGQFLSRVAAFAPPQGAARIVIANPSSYVAPSLDEAAPYGLGNVFSEKREALDALRTYLGLRLTIYLGSDDTGSKDLHNHPAARRQGVNRLDRGNKMFQAARTLAHEKGWPFGWTLVTAQGVGHSAKRMLSSEAAAEAFGWPGTGAAVPNR